MTSTTILGAGSLTKKERLKEVNTKLFNTCVLEVQDPFPGYYHEVPVIKSINSIFLLVRGNFFPENILRATNLVKRSLDIDFDAAYSRLSFGKSKETHVAIRLEGIKEYEDIKVIQQAYSDAEIEFEPDIKPDLSDAALLNINRVYSLQEVGEGVFKDEYRKDMLFLLLENGGNWDWFEKLTYRVKSNFRRENFDAAHSVIYKKGGLYEFVRIYDDKMSIEEAVELKRMYDNYS